MKKILMPLGAAAVLFAAVGPSVGFNLIQAPRKWFQGVNGGPDDTPVLFLVNQGGESSVADADNGVTAVRNATALWEPELENGLNLLSTGTTSSNAVGNDGQNVTSFEDPARIVRNAIAVTLIGFATASQSETVNGISFARYLDTDTSFSKKLSFTTQAIGGCSGAFDIQATQTHEIGHALGLDHSGVGSALMFASIGSCEFKRIASDDHDGINTIYNPGFGGGSSCTPSEVNLTSHGCAAPANGPNCLTVTIGVSNDCGDPAAGVPVTVELAGSSGDLLTGTANTGSNGLVTFGLRCNNVSSTSYVSTVTSIGGALPWNTNGDTAPNPIPTCVPR